MVKRAVSLAIWEKDKVLIVQRPASDEDLPLIWGLPASSIRTGESLEAAVIRTGKEKLGVSLEPIRTLSSGFIERDTYRLEMVLYEATMNTESIELNHGNQSITQYEDWSWGKSTDLKVAAQKGSLCSQLYLQFMTISFE